MTKEHYKKDAHFWDWLHQLDLEGKIHYLFTNSTDKQEGREG